mmetsp:Transcript_724/g.1301  ORF Transcript_724/g.1301 Transcript_724/m.1301 type:complete len:270 (-) Transcript_724:348-1157(-)
MPEIPLHAAVDSSVVVVVQETERLENVHKESKQLSNLSHFSKRLSNVAIDMGGRLAIISCCCRENREAEDGETSVKPKITAKATLEQPHAVEIKLEDDTDDRDENEIKELRAVINDLYLQNKLQKQLYRKKLRNTAGSSQYSVRRKGVSFSSRVKVHIIDSQEVEDPVEETRSPMSQNGVKIGPIDGAAEYVAGMFKRGQEKSPVRGQYGALSTSEDDSSGDISGDSGDYCSVEIDLEESDCNLPAQWSLRRPDVVSIGPSDICIPASQ